jgi:predicted permease
LERLWGSRDGLARHVMLTGTTVRPIPSTRPMDSLLLDLRYALRSMRSRPGFTLLAVLTLAIGIGANTVAFSAFNALLLRPFDRPDVDRLGWLMMAEPGNPHGSTSLPDYEEFIRAARSFDAMVAEGRLPVSLRIDGNAAEQGWALAVSTNYLDVLGARPSVGRVFTASDLAHSELPAVVSHRFWNQRLGGGDSPAGRSIVVNGRSFSIVGVLPDSFQGPGGLYAPDLWIPLERLQVFAPQPELRTRQATWLTIVGRIKPGVTHAQAEAELKGIARQLASDHPATNKERSAAWYAMADGHPEVRGMAPIAWVALAVVGVVLLIACFNVAGLLLARASERQREIGVRGALGATRGRIVRQLLTEGSLLALASGVAALVIASWSSELLSTFSIPIAMPQRLHLGVDRRLILFTAALVFIAGALPALVPALQATRGDLFRSMRAQTAAGGRPSRARNIFVIAQIAGSTLFLAAALLFVRSFVKAAAFDPGFETTRSLVLEVDPAHYGYSAARARSFFDNLTARIRDLPGVQAASVGDRVPFYIGFPKIADVAADASACTTAECGKATVYSVGARYFEALGVPLHSGRDFSDHELKTGDAIVISQQMAKSLWPGRSAIGQSLRLGKERRAVQVIGVAGDIKYRAMAERPGSYVFRPLADTDFAQNLTVVVRTMNDPRQHLTAVQEQLRAVDAMVPAGSLETMTQRMEMPLWPARTAAGFFLICGALALVLASVGLFGVTYYAVGQRTKEFGIRTALGATPKRVLLQVLGESVRLAIPGVVLGTIAALIAGRLLARGLFGVSPADPLSFGAAAALEALVALAACALPAWRATRADPIAALRQE